MRTKYLYMLRPKNFFQGFFISSNHKKGTFITLIFNKKKKNETSDKKWRYNF